jgi:hypothetical protein
MCITWNPKYTKCQHVIEAEYTTYYCYLARHRKDCKDEFRNINRMGLCPACAGEEKNRKLDEKLNEVWRVESKVWEDSGRKEWMGGVFKVGV